MSYRIVTDTCCDYPEQMYKELNLSVVSLQVHFKGETRSSYSEKWLKGMFDGLRNGESATTSAANPQDWENAIEPILQAGEDALVLTFTSGLSATYQSAVIAAEELTERYPERKVLVVDTLCASLGQGLFVYYACKKRDEGLSLEELAQWCEDHKQNLCHWFTVDDLMYLKRGGRISAATAIAGSLLKIKPVLHADENGKLVNVSKTRGRKASIDAIADKMGELGLPGENETVFICHGDCWDDAEYLGKLVKERYGVKNVFAYYVGAVIGSHSGPGTLALFFLGKHR